jgi:hypothetical protein
VYTLAIVHNFININKPDNLVENEVIDKKDTELAEAESNIIIN